MFLAKNYKFILKNYIFILAILSIYYLIVRNNVLSNNAMSEWVINYQGGFVRRGFLGEVIFQISNLFSLNLRFSFLIFQSLLYIFYYILIYNLLKNIKPNYLVILSIFSPIFIIFPIAELEALGRKEILIFIALIVSINLYFKYINNNLILIFISIIFPVLILVHEGSIFYSFFFLSLIFITKLKFNYKFFFKLILLGLPTFICIYLVYSNPHSVEDTARMCEELKKIGEECGLATIFLSKSIVDHNLEVGWQLNHILRYIFIFVVGFFSLIYLSFISEFNPQKINNFFCSKPFILNIILLILPSLIMYLIAVDSGRWTHMTYSCSFIYYFGLLKNEAIILKKNTFEFNFQNKKTKNFFYTLFFVLVCLTWNPKAVYHEDLGSFPIYRVLEKTPNYYKSIFALKVFR